MTLSTNRIVIVGNDTIEHRQCCQTLKEGGYSVDIISMEQFSQLTALSQSSSYACALIDSTDVLSRQWQEIRSSIPVIALLDSVSTPRNILYDRGVIDYVLKPIYAMELTFRIFTVIQNAKTGADGIVLGCESKPMATNELEQPSNRKELALVERACAWLDRHLAKKHQLDDIAITLGTNRSKLAALFKAHLGQGVFEWLTDRRMVKARSLLLDSELSIQEIGFEVGYVNCGHFSTAYKKQFKFTPSQQRKQRTL